MRAAGLPRSAQKRSSVYRLSASDRLEAKRSDFSTVPWGMWARQLSIGEPIIAWATLAAPRCAAMDKPYGPAPTTMVSQLVMNLISLECEAAVRRPGAGDAAMLLG